MGQVWSKADCSGILELCFLGGAGGPLAVTSLNSGGDGVWNTSDDILSPMNQRPANVTVDSTPNGNCADIRDSVRGFAGKHVGGVLFVFADGSARLISESIDPPTYRALSTMSGGEIVSE